MEENKENTNSTVESGNIVINENAIPAAPAPGEQIQSPSQVPVTEQKPVKKKGPLIYIIIGVVLVVLAFLIYARFFDKDKKILDSISNITKSFDDGYVFNEKTERRNTLANDTSSNDEKNETTNSTLNDYVGDPVVTTKGNVTMKANKKSNGCSVFEINGKIFKESCKLGSDDVEINEIVNDNYALVHYNEGHDAYQVIDSNGDSVLDPGNNIIGHVEQNGDKMIFIVNFIPYDDNNIRDIAGCNPSTAGNYNTNATFQELYEANVSNGVIDTPVKTKSQTVGEMRSFYKCDEE